MENVMARPRQDGLRYFPLDTDFFYSDKRIKALKARYGCDGIVIYIYLLTEVYRNGYYIVWDEDAEDNILSELNISSGLIKQVMEYLVSRSLLTQTSILDSPVTDANLATRSLQEVSTLVNPVTIITSPGIQKRYQEAVKGLKRDVIVNPEIWLLDQEQTAPYIKFTLNDGKSEKNGNKSEKNGGKSEKNDTNKIKQKEIKINHTVSRFNDFTAAYPKPIKNRYLAETAYCRLLLDDVHLREDDLITAARNYAEAVSILKTGERYIKEAQNFLKDGFWVAYLDGNYVRPKVEKSRKGHGFEQRDYDFDALERELLGGKNEGHKDALRNEQ